MASAGRDAAAIYTRQSHGKERSIAEQEADGRGACDSNGWNVFAVYTDTVSASRFSRKERPDWSRLLADLESGQFGVLVMWESSRGDRDPETWMGLLRRCRDHDTWIHVVSHDRTYDMRKRRDWRTLADEGVDSADESWKISDRVLRAMRDNAIKGRPHGITLFGYERVYDEHTRKLKQQRPHDTDAPLVREIFAAANEGVPLSRIAANLNERSLASPKGARWTRATVRQLLTNPGYIGKRRAGSTALSRKFTATYDGDWPSIVDETVFWRVQRRLADPARKVTRPGRQKWLLSYLAQCGECGAHLAVFHGGARYGCSEKGCTYISRELLDLYVSELVIAWTDMHGREALAASASEDREAVDARDEIERLNAELDELAGNTEISARRLAIREAALLPKIKAAEERARRATLPPALLTITEDDIRVGWDGAELSAKRDAIKSLMTVSVRKPAHRGEFPGRVDINWRQGSTP